MTGRPIVSSALRGFSSWLLVGGVLALYTWAAAELLAAHLRYGAPIVAWVALLGPPAVYAGALVLCVRGLSTGRLATLGVIGVLHVFLSVVTTAFYVAVGPLPFAAVPGWTLWGFAGTLVQLLTVPLLVLPLCRLREPSAAPLPPVRPPGATPWPARPPRLTTTPVRRPDVVARTGSVRAVTTSGRRPPGPGPDVGSRDSRDPGRESMSLAPPRPVPPAQAASVAPVPEVPAPVTGVPDAGPQGTPETSPPETVPLPAPESAPGRPPAIPAPLPLDPGAPRVVHRSEARRVSTAFGRTASLTVDVQHLMGLTLYTAVARCVPCDAVVSTAFRFLPLIGNPLDGQLASQATLRGPGGALVMTPLGAVSRGGPLLVVATRARGALAMLELCARRVAMEYRARHPELSRGCGASGGVIPAGTPLAEPVVPSGWAAIGHSLDGLGTVVGRALYDPAGPLRLYLVLSPTADPHRLGRFAGTLYRETEMGGDPSPVGWVESIALRIGDDQVFIQPVRAASHEPTLLAALGRNSGRPGRARRELERLAAVLAAA